MSSTCSIPSCFTTCKCTRVALRCFADENLPEEKFRLSEKTPKRNRNRDEAAELRNATRRSPILSEGFSIKYYSEESRIVLRRRLNSPSPRNPDQVRAIETRTAGTSRTFVISLAGLWRFTTGRPCIFAESAEIFSSARAIYATRPDSGPRTAVRSFVRAVKLISRGNYSPYSRSISHIA